MIYDFYRYKYSEQEIREYIEENPGKLYRFTWLYICTYQKLSEDFIRDFQNEIHWWSYISEYQKLSEEFLIEFIEKIDIAWLKYNENISEDVKERVLSLTKVIDQ